jgi:hypothetical protein
MIEQEFISEKLKKDLNQAFSKNERKFFSGMIEDLIENSIHSRFQPQLLPQKSEIISNYFAKASLFNDFESKKFGKQMARIIADLNTYPYKPLANFTLNPLLKNLKINR